MRIGIELRQLSLGCTGGISVFVGGILETLFSLYLNHEFYVFCSIFSRAILKRIPGNTKVMTLPMKSFFSEVDRICTEEKIQVLFRTYPMVDDLNFPLSKQIFLIPDLQHEVFPEFFSPEVLRARRISFNRALSGAGAVGTISLYTRQIILAHEWTACRHIFIMSPALPAECRQPFLNDLTTEEISLIPANDFFLYPANLWPHKNHLRVLKAFELFLKETGQGMEFVFTGYPEGWPELRASFPDLPVRHLGFVRPELLYSLFLKAKALVFFSLYEGFGIPLLEAFSAGTPVICSNITSLPEVGGKAVVTCDPTDMKAMSRLMAQIIEDQGLRQRLTLEGKKTLKSYTWEKSAENLFGACQRLMKEARSKVIVIPAALKMQEHPLVSIITPSYNQGRFLRRTIESVLKQTYQNIEYVVIDGGSKDESTDILETYGKKLKWISEPDNGQSNAINKGFSLSRGEIRAYLNSDDVLLNDAVEKVVEYFREHPEADLIYGRANYIDENDSITGIYNTADYCFSRLMQDCCICQPAAFWRTRIAKKVGPFNEKLNFTMDYEYWLRVDRAGGCVRHIPDKIACSRQYPETKTLSARRQIYKEIFEICQEHGGYVDLNYFYGLWQHLICKSEFGRPVRFLRLQNLFKIMAKLHHKWYHIRRKTIREISLSLASKAKPRFSQGLSTNSKIVRLTLPLVHRISGRMFVTGFWADNWLGPKCCVLVRRNSQGKEYYVSGVPSVDMTLRVKSKMKTLQVFSLKANQCKQIRFRLDPHTDSVIQLRFSKYAIDSVNRPLSFRLMDTNLFTEDDIF